MDLGDPITFVALAGVGVQRLVEALDQVWDACARRWGPPAKKTAATIASVVFGGILASSRLGFSSHTPTWGAWVVDTLLIAGGTEAFNSVIKILSSAKEASQKKAARTLPEGDPVSIAAALPDVRHLDLNAPPA